MILKIRNWCEELIIAIILCVIIECLIPSGNNKKYAKVIIGIYILFITINPILEMLNYEYDFKNAFSIQYEETSNSFDSNIKDVYILGLKETIKEEIINIGYEISKIEMEFDNKYENINEMKIEILNNGKIYNSEDYEKIKKLVAEKFLINENHIFIIFK